jgi:uncharacterized integral membrane protein
MDEVEEVEGPTSPAPKESGPGFPWVGVFTIFGLIAIVVFAVQNTEEVAIDFLGFTGVFPLSTVILTTALVSGIVGSVAGSFFRARRVRRRAERDELKRLRG